MSKRLTLALAATLALGACATTPAPATGSPAAAAAAPAAPKKHSYTETIRSVLVSEDGKHLVAIGSSHHYIFDAPANLVDALHSSLHTHLAAVFSPFHVAATGDVAGDVTVKLDDAASDAERTAAAKLGLARDADGHWQSTTRLYGHRFGGWTYAVGNEKDALNRAYTIEIESDESTAARVADQAGTPIRIAADGVQLLYYAPLAPVIVPMIFLLSAKDR